MSEVGDDLAEGGSMTKLNSLMMRKSLFKPCPMKIQPRSTSKRNFLYATFDGTRVW